MKEKNYISLQEASESCDYSQEYLSLRARTGKLKAKKLGRNWFTTKQYLDEYILKYEGRLQSRRQNAFKREGLSARRTPATQTPRLQGPTPALKQRFIMMLAGFGLFIFAITGFGVIRLSDTLYELQKPYGQQLSTQIRKSFSGIITPFSGVLKTKSSEYAIVVSDKFIRSTIHINGFFNYYSSLALYVDDYLYLSSVDSGITVASILDADFFTSSYFSIPPPNVTQKKLLAPLMPIQEGQAAAVSAYKSINQKIANFFGSTYIKIIEGVVPGYSIEESDQRISASQLSHELEKIKQELEELKENNSTTPAVNSASAPEAL